MSEARKWRFRWSQNHRRGEWAFGIGRSYWPRPLPRGMAMYVIHLLWWNFILDKDL